MRRQGGRGLGVLQCFRRIRSLQLLRGLQVPLSFCVASAGLGPDRAAPGSEEVTCSGHLSLRGQNVLGEALLCTFELLLLLLSVGKQRVKLGVGRDDLVEGCQRIAVLRRLGPIAGASRPDGRR